MKTFWVGVICLFCVGVVRGAPEALLIPPTEVVQAGRPLHLTLFLNNPTTEVSEFVLPVPMRAELVSTHEQRTVDVVPSGTVTGSAIPLGPMSFTQVSLTVLLPDTLDGNVALRITDPESNSVMFAVTPAAVVQVSPEAIAAAISWTGMRVPLMTGVPCATVVTSTPSR